jgi:hypothetical protein
MAAWMNGGVFNERRILKAETVGEALRLHNRASGICLIWNRLLGDWYGHSGGVNGASSYMEFHPRDKVGLIILSNMYLKSSNPMYHPAGRIYALIRNHANRFRSSNKRNASPAIGGFHEGQPKELQGDPGAAFFSKSSL